MQSAYRIIAGHKIRVGRPLDRIRDGLCRGRKLGPNKVTGFGRENQLRLSLLLFARATPPAERMTTLTIAVRTVSAGLMLPLLLFPLLFPPPFIDELIMDELIISTEAETRCDAACPVIP